MLDIIFLQFLEISITTSIIIVVLRLLSSYLNNTYAVRWKYWVWLLLALRLTLPIKLAIFTPVAPVNITIPTIFLIAPNNAVLPSSASNTTFPGQEQALTDSLPKAISYLEVLAVLWIIGIAVFMIYQIAGYLTFKAKILRWSKAPKNESIPNIIASLSSTIGLTKKVTPLISDAVCNPMMIGFFRPLLILPNEMYSETDLRFILHHELIHCKRNDLWYKLLLVFTNALHWFNPFAYMMFKEACDDLELSCDDRVIKDSSFAERKAYTETLLTSIHQQTMKKTALSTYFQGRSKIMKTRFTNILTMKHRKNGIFAFLFLAIFIGLMGSLVACSLNDKKLAKEETLIGYISLDNDILKFDEIEYITSEDKERIKELNLTDEDMPNGFRIYNESDELSTYKINNETVFNFLDYDNQFVHKDDSNRYTTTDKEVFKQYIDSHYEDLATPPFWIKVEGKTVLTVTEQYLP